MAVEVTHRMIPANEVRPGDVVFGGEVLAVYRTASRGVGAVVVIETDAQAAPDTWLPESNVMVLHAASYRARYLPAYSTKLGVDCTCGHPAAETETGGHSDTEGACRERGCRCLDYTPDR